MNKEILILKLIISFVLIFILTPICSFLFAYIGGWCLKVVAGDTIVKGLNIIFNTDRFNKEYLPTIFGTLGILGSYLRTTINNSENKNSDTLFF